ncbi:MAG: hypothetical protein GY913_27330 [Proteobacteria bacterium]|nr:hypothetical protein [Pseudomonadota bacterium]MCP4920628.1 hypothetical protein [Pseudomonadota bacterium]
MIHALLSLLVSAPAQAADDRINPLAANDEHNLGRHALAEEESHFKPGTGLVFQSEDGDFMMAPRLRVQFRDELELADGDVSNTFGLRRARLQFKGHVFGEDNRYKAEFAFSPKDLSMKDGVPHRTPLLSWYSEHTQMPNLSVRVGQYKLLYSRQRVVSSGNQEFVDRSLAQGEFNLDRDIGFHLFSKDLFELDKLKYYTGASIAEGRDSWESELLTDSDAPPSWQVLGRVEVNPFGHFKDYSEVDFKRLDNPRLSVGVAYARTANGDKDRGYLGSAFTDDGTVTYDNVTADVVFKWAGLTTFAEYYYRRGERSKGALTAADATDEDVFLARNGMGGSIQVGYLLPGVPVGIGGRYSTLGPWGFSQAETSVTNEHEAGGVLSYYFAGHPYKIQADYFRVWTDEDQGNRVRVQMQVAY